MVKSYRDVTFNSHSIISISLAFTLGVILGSWLRIDSYLLVGLLLVLVLLNGERISSMVICGMFIFSSYRLSAMDYQIPTAILDISSKFCDYIDSLPFHNNVLAKAFLQGDKSGLDGYILHDFRKAGASHLLALSGLHIGIIYLLVEKGIQFLDKREWFKWFRYVFLVGLTAFFTLMTGAKPSIVRAFLFILIRESSIVLKFTTDPIKILCSALLIQLIIDPMMINSVGFQLSYAAVTGIAVYNCTVAQWKVGNSIVQFIWNTSMLAIFCQLFTAPFALFYFYTVPKYFLLANLIAIPLTTIFMYCSITIILLSVIGCCPEYFYTITDWFGDALLFSLKVIGSL